jgi:general secretion pathway protein K
MRNEKGFALVLTLVVTALMVAVAAEMIHQVYVDTSISRGFRDGQQASLLAESGIYGGKKLLEMALAIHPDYTTLSDSWAKPFKQEDATGSIEISVVDESGKINLNDVILDSTELTLNALKQLGKRLQIPEDCWSSLADWVDSNDETRSGGAETPYYMSLRPPYRARNEQLKTLKELSLVKGFTPEMVEKLRPFVTIYSRGGISWVNVNTAPKEVIMALDARIDDRMADRILEQRKLKPFTNIDNLSRVDSAIGTSLAGKTIYKGEIFRITAIARVKETARTVEAVVRLSDGKYLSWQEY